MVHKTFFLFFIISIFLGATSISAEQSSPADEYYIKSGLIEHVRLVPELILSGFSQKKNSGQSRMTDSDFEGLKKIIRKSFDPERIRKEITADLSESADEHEITENLQWLTSPLGKKIIQMEIISSSPESRREQEKLAEKQINSLGSPERLNLLLKLDEVSRSTDFAVDMQLNMQVALFSAMYSSSPETRKTAFEKLAEDAKNSRFKVKAIMQQSIIAGSFHTYRDLTDNEISRYIQFHEKKSTRKCQDIVMQSLNKSLMISSKNLGESISRLAKKRQEKNDVEAD